MVRRWTVARGIPDDDTIDRVCRAVNYACIWYPKQVLCLQCAFVTTYLLRKKRSPCAHGPWRAEASLQGPRLGRSQRAGDQREIECPGDLRRVGPLLDQETGMSVQAGVWNFDGRPVDPKQIENVSEFLKQQGPDGESHYVDGSVALLYRPFPHNGRVAP